MAKTYRTPVVASLGAAEVMTKAVSVGPHLESNPSIKTTAAMLDL